MPIRAVIFDFNGVLVDDEHVHFALFREVLADAGVDLDEETYHASYLGYDDRGCFTAALSDSGLDAPPGLIADLIARKAARYVEVAETELRFFRSADSSITDLAATRPVAICSGALRAEIEYALERLGVRPYVGSITSAEDTSACKPDPEGYRVAFDRLRALLHDLDPAEVLVIEDSLAGIQAARAAGMLPIGVSNTYAPTDLIQAGAIAVIMSLDILTSDWVDSLNDVM